MGKQDDKKGGTVTDIEKGRKRKTGKKTASKKTTGARQTVMAETMDPMIAVLHQAATDYRALLDERMALQKREADAQAHLLLELKKADKAKKLAQKGVYRHGGIAVFIEKTETERARVRKLDANKDAPS